MNKTLAILLASLFLSAGILTFFAIKDSDSSFNTEPIQRTSDSKLLPW